MTTWRLFPSTNGPASSTSFTGNIVEGVLFKVTAPGLFLQGYWWWRADSAQAASASFALWQATGAGTGSLIANTSASSSSLVTGQWNYVPLTTLIPLASGTVYKACVGTVNNFPFTTGQFGPAEPFASGITNGPLTAFSGPTASLPDGFGDAQCSFDTSTANPAAVYPTSSNNDYNAWVDVQVSTVATPVPAPARTEVISRTSGRVVRR